MQCVRVYTQLVLLRAHLIKILLLLLLLLRWPRKRLAGPVVRRLWFSENDSANGHNYVRITDADGRRAEGVPGDYSTVETSIVIGSGSDFHFHVRGDICRSIIIEKPCADRGDKVY